MSGRLYLGIDGGQSSTEALIGDESGRVLGRGIAGPCNHVTGPEAIHKFRKAITGAVEAACREAGLVEEELSFDAICLGLSGGPEDKAEHIREIILSRHYKITHDAEIALTGALAGAPGIIVIAGTGSIAYGRNAEGHTARAGGWGYVFGDEGGAFDITRRALRAALRMEEGWGPETVLRARLLEATGAATANQLLHLFYTPEYPRSHVATLAPIVDRAATDGDAEARSILLNAANDLAFYVAGVHHNIFRTGRLSVSYIGGVFESEILGRQFRAIISEKLHCDVRAPAKSAAEGALMEALWLKR